MILLDTHALVWWLADPARLPAALRRRLDDTIAAGEVVLVSAISSWEIAMLVERGRLELTMDPATWIHKAESLPFVQFVPVNNVIALGAVALAGFPHSDPADRIIVATALQLGAALVTADERIGKWGKVRTIWGEPA